MVKLVAEAHTSEEIARAARHQPAKTVERHRENILGKLGMRDRVRGGGGGPPHARRAYLRLTPRKGGEP